MQDEPSDPAVGELNALRRENQTLRDRCASLEAQVMELAREPERDPRWLEKVIFVFEDGDDDEPDQMPMGA